VTDSEYNDTRARIVALAGKWLAPLGLKWWKVHLEYAREGFDAEERHQANAQATAYTNASWKYLEATFTFHLPRCAAMEDDELEYVFVHECCHALVNEQREVVRHNGTDETLDLGHEERVCTTLAKAFLWTWAAATEARDGVQGRDIAAGHKIVAGSAAADE